jgi:N-methylhydantoinase B
MMGALRVVSAEKGYDPRRFALVACGGAGPLHTGQLAELLGTPTVLIPPHPGILSALGLLSTDLQHDAMRTFAIRLPNGTYSFQDYLDSDGVTEQSYSVHLTLHKENDNVTLDFRNTSDQARGAVNFIMHESVHKFMYSLYLTADDPTVLLNAGFIQAIGEVQTRKGSLVNPVFPAPLGMRSNTLLRVNNCVFGTLALATEGQTSAASPVYVIYI